MRTKNLVLSLSLAAFIALGAPALMVDETAKAINPKTEVRLTESAEAFNIWSLLIPIFGGALNNLVNPERTDVWPASAPTLELETPDRQYLPPILVSRQQAIILKKGVRIKRVKPGVVGPPLEYLEYWVDGDGKLLSGKIKDGAFFVGTARGDERFDTSNPIWEAGAIYTLNLEFKCERDARSYGRQGWNAVQILILDDEPFRLAATDPNYRQYLSEHMGGTPSIPVTRHIDGQGNIGYSFGSGTGQPAVPTPTQAGVTQPNQPVAAEQRGGLDIIASHRGQPITGELRLKRTELGTPIVFQAGGTAAFTAVQIHLPYRQEPWTVVQPGKGQNISLKKLVPGTYPIQAQARGADGTLGPAIQFNLIVE